MCCVCTYTCTCMYMYAHTYTGIYTYKEKIIPRKQEIRMPIIDKANICINKYIYY